MCSAGCRRDGAAPRPADRRCRRARRRRRPRGSCAKSIAWRSPVVVAYDATSVAVPGPRRERRSCDDCWSGSVSSPCADGSSRSARSRPRAAAVPAARERDRGRHPSRPLEARRSAAGHARAGRIAGGSIEIPSSPAYNELLAEGLVDARRRRHVRPSRSRRRCRRRRPRHRGADVCGRAAAAANARHEAAAARHADAVERACRTRASFRARAGARVSACDRAERPRAADLFAGLRPRAPAPRALRDAVAHARPRRDAGKPDGDAQHRAGDRSRRARAAGAGRRRRGRASGYPPAWNVLRLAGARLVPLPLDDDGFERRRTRSAARRTSACARCS